MNTYHIPIPAGDPKSDLIVALLADLSAVYPDGALTVSDCLRVETSERELFPLLASLVPAHGPDPLADRETNRCNCTVETGVLMAYFDDEVPPKLFAPTTDGKVLTPAEAAQALQAPAAAPKIRNYAPRQCPTCGELFTPTGSRQKVCSLCQAVNKTAEKSAGETEPEDQPKAYRLDDGATFTVEEITKALRDESLPIGTTVTRIDSGEIYHVTRRVTGKLGLKRQKE